MINAICCDGEFLVAEMPLKYGLPCPAPKPQRPSDRISVDGDLVYPGEVDDQEFLSADEIVGAYDPSNMTPVPIIGHRLPRLKPEEVSSYRYHVRRICNQSTLQPATKLTTRKFAPNGWEI